ncbi:iron superoxide dismutase, putative [Bodo saltans]|uniref:Superoxide dismutase n=1 Tax=Bodo saltans TaxID=75058 RepID=A0A0S4ISK3_BODSA|nr:iron superoxide dismutase, putative [Bodo saltans]|eukprot:CUF58200.1 iron superoxide dismutase, putative [Bodo saltans]
MAFSIPPLPYGYDGLVAKGLSKEQLTYHFDKHHQGYVVKLNAAAATNEALAKKSIEEIIGTEKGPIFNLAAQIFNHTFFWNSLSPNGGGEPKGKIGDAINASFGSFDKFKDEFTNAAVGHFGSGWAWLVKDGNNNLKVYQSHDAATPLTEGLKPILTCDVWEHAYYVDYRNDRAAYIKTFWNAVNWEFAESNL